MNLNLVVKRAASSSMGWDGMGQDRPNSGLLSDHQHPTDVSLDLLLYSERECQEQRQWRTHVIGRAFREGAWRFRVQQAVEKALKAWLLEVGGDPPLTHALHRQRLVTDSVLSGG